MDFTEKASGITKINSYWDKTFEEMKWFPGGFLNMAHESIDRHARSHMRNKLALIWEGNQNQIKTYTFHEIKTESDRTANVLKSLGITKGDRIFVYMNRIPELYFTFLAALKIGALVSCISPLLDKTEVKKRMSDNHVKVVFTQPHLRMKMGDIVYELFDLQHIVVVNGDLADAIPLNMADLSYEEEVSKADDDFRCLRTSQLDEATITYTSGNQGNPKAIIHSHQAVVQQFASGKSALELTSEDIYWCTFDPGNMIGLTYGITAPWSNGVTQLMTEDNLDVASTFKLLQKYNISVLLTSPENLTSLKVNADDISGNVDLPKLKRIINIGQILHTDVAKWWYDHINFHPINAYIETECGSIVCSTSSENASKSGSIGKPVEGIDLAILDDKFKPLANSITGNLAVHLPFPSLFESYSANTELYRSRIKKNWYITGDQAWKDQDGDYWLEK